jgi:hypothetical protein
MSNAMPYMQQIFGCFSAITYRTPSPKGNRIRNKRIAVSVHYQRRLFEQRIERHVWLRDHTTNDEFNSRDVMSDTHDTRYLVNLQHLHSDGRVLSPYKSARKKHSTRDEGTKRRASNQIAPTTSPN